MQRPDLAEEKIAHSEHVRSAVRRGRFSAQPFPHLFVSDLLPNQFYSDLQASWPAFDEMARPNPTIGRLDFVDPGFQHTKPTDTSLSESQLQNWSIFRALMNGPYFEESFGNFRPYLKRLGRELLAPPAGRRIADFFAGLLKRPDVSFWSEAKPADFMPRDQFLTVRKDLCVLAPHIDPPHFHFTLIVYFAPDADHKHLGTTLFRQVGRGRARLPSEWREPMYTQYAVQYEIACEPDTTIPFIPNAALLFLNGLHSWHGQHLTEPMERRTYNSFFTVQRCHLLNALRQQDVARLEEQKLIF